MRANHVTALRFADRLVTALSLDSFFFFFFLLCAPLKLYKHTSHRQQGTIAEAAHNKGTEKADSLKTLDGKVPEQLGCQTSGLFTLQLPVLCYCPSVSCFFAYFNH